MKYGFVFLITVITLNIAHAKVLTHTDKHSYDIFGTTLESLQRALQSRPLDALSEWEVTWKYNTRQLNSLCKATDPEVTINITITMPNWINKHTADPALQQRWAAYYRKLYQHEELHIKNGLLAATKIDKMIASTFPRANCFYLKRSLDKKAQHIIKQQSDRSSDLEPIL